jgi:hypothetical protein
MITVSGLTIFKASSTPGANRHNPTRRSMLLRSVAEAFYVAAR